MWRAGSPVKGGLTAKRLAKRKSPYKTAIFRPCKSSESRYYAPPFGQMACDGHKIMPIASPQQYAAMLDAAQQGDYAYPAVNVTSIVTINAAL